MGCIQSYRHSLLQQKDREESHHMLPAQIEELSAISVIELRSNTQNPLIGKINNSTQASEMILTQYITPDLNSLEVVNIQEVDPGRHQMEERILIPRTHPNPFNRSIEKLRSRSFSDFHD